MKYQTVSGHVIDLSPSSEVRAHLDELQRMASDPGVPEATFIATAYGPTSPIMDPNVMPGVGMVTAAVMAKPEYAVVRDLYYRKSLASRGIPLESVERQYTLTPADAAERLGIHVSAVRQAIASGRLPSWIKDGRHYLHPDTVRAFAPERRGPAPEGHAVHVIFGSDGEHVLKLKADAPLLHRARVAPHIEAADVDAGWKRIAVLTVDKHHDKERLFILAPASTEDHVGLRTLRVSGRFRIVEKINNAREARRVWKEFPGTQ